MGRNTVCVFHASSVTALAYKAGRAVGITQELEEAMEYCRENDVKAKKCLKDNPDKWPHVTINKLRRRMEGKVVNGRENEKRALLSQRETQELADAMRTAAIYGNPMTVEGMNATLIDMLWYRTKLNKKGGRKYVKLSGAASIAMENKCAGRAFWRAFFAKPEHKDLKRKDQVTHPKPLPFTLNQSDTCVIFADFADLRIQQK